MATSLLAACHINAAKQETNSAESAKQEMKKGVELLKRAQLLEGRAAQVNIQFAEIHFQRKDFAKSEAMVQQVLAATDNAQVKSMAHYILGKIFHVNVGCAVVSV